MHKIVKIGLSFLLILSIILNPLGSLFDIRVRAVAVETVICFILGGICSAVANGLVFSMAEQAVDTYGDDVIASCEQAKLNIMNTVDNLNQMGNYILLDNEVYDSMNGTNYKVGKAYVNPDCGLTGKDLEMVQLICDGINERVANGADITLIGDVNALGNVSISQSTYENLKEIVCESIIKEYYEDIENDVIDMADSGVLPVYDFSFVGPQPSISAPVINGIASLQKDGFIFTPPISSNKGKFSSQADVMTYLPFGNDVIVRGNETNGFIGSVKTNCYGYSHYVLYNGTLYYYNQGSYTGSQYEVSFGYTGDFGFTKTIFYASDGTCLADVYKEGDSFSHGFCVNTTGQVPSYAPTLASVTDKDFTTEIGGSSVGVLRTDSEDTIGNSIGLGILNPDSLLEIGADGSIVGADGIELAKLQELCDLIKSGNLQFENVQEYLDLITKLVGAGNLTATEQLVILGNIEKLTTTQAKSIEEINAAVTSISSALTIDGDIDLETPDLTIIDKFPFCLPFDLYYIFTLLCQEPKEPVFEIPIQTTIKTGGLNYEIDESIVLDLTIFRLKGYDMVQIFTQTSITLLFCVCLIGATKKLMWS